MSFNTTDYPYNTVVYVTDRRGSTTYQGSGVLISPDEVLTASHLIYQTDAGLASNIQVAPGYGGGFRPYGTFNASWVHAITINDAGGTISNTDSQNDYAIIHLSQPVYVGTMGVQPDFGGGAVNFTGYPASYGGAEVSGSETVSKNPNYTLLNGAPTGAGSSGAPLWIVQNGQPYVVGLVSSESGTVGYNVQITGAVAQVIAGWVNQDDYYDPLVDSPFYRAANPDVAAAPESAAYHYDTFGWHEGRDPSAYFSTQGYLGTYRDVLAAGVDPLTHYDQSGWREGRDPAANFDTTLYLLHNPDVANAGIDPLMHFLLDGRAEGRAAYAAIGTSVTAGFDPEYYLLANPDVAAAGVDPATHFFSIGWKEGRNPDAFFDTRGYLNAYADVAQAGINPLLHYDQYGWREGRDPSAGFDTKAYLKAYGDVAAAGIDPLEHYLQSGAYELRSTFPDGRFG